MALKIIVLAAGEGKRMHSQTPKVLHDLAGKTLAQHVLDTAALCQADETIIIYGHQGEVVKKALAQYSLQWVLQEQPLGTGHAVRQALAHIAEEDTVLILYADVPLLSTSTLQALCSYEPASPLCLLTAYFSDATGLGRIIRDPGGDILRIVEEKDANEKERAIQEIYTGVMRVRGSLLHQLLPQLHNHNGQNEYYLTDIIAMTIAQGARVSSVLASHEEEVLGVNDLMQLARLERYYQQRMAHQLLASGVLLRDPLRFDCRGQAFIAEDVSIDVNVILEGKVTIGKGTAIGPNCYLRNTTIGNHVIVKANTVIDSAKIADGCIIGPFARLRPGTELKSQVHIGNFVEIKKSQIKERTKINHLSYVGDADVGKDVNIGAGTITCNYDGLNKHQTIIEDDVHIGSDSQLIAPVTIGKGATIGAGATIVKDAPSGKLTLSRHEQLTLSGWRRPHTQKQDKKVE